MATTPMPRCQSGRPPGPGTPARHPDAGQHHPPGINRRADQILVITAAYTGMHGGELAGLARANTHLGDGLIRVHPEVSAPHEVQGRLYLRPPKTANSVRDSRWIGFGLVWLALTAFTVDAVRHSAKRLITVTCRPPR